MNRRGMLSTLLGLAGASAMPRRVVAQARFPSRPVHLVVANPAGGIGDVLSRLFGDKAAVELGQPFVIENRPGASTTIGTQYVARATPDGYTLLNVTTSGVVQTVLKSHLPYDLEQDFVPIVTIGYSPMVIAVPASSNIRTLDDLATAARSPNGITFGSGGVGRSATWPASACWRDCTARARTSPTVGAPRRCKA